jgi:hypothetical protein
MHSVTYVDVVCWSVVLLVQSAEIGFILFRYIEVKTPDLAKKTIEVMHRSDIRGRQIIVREVGRSAGFNYY